MRRKQAPTTDESISTNCITNELKSQKGQAKKNLEKCKQRHRDMTKSGKREVWVKHPTSPRCLKLTWYDSDRKQLEIMNDNFRKTFKTLVFTDDRQKSLGDFAVIAPYDNSIGGCNVPDLMTIEASITDLKKMFPKTDFTGTRLITVVVHPVISNNT